MNIIQKKILTITFITSLNILFLHANRDEIHDEMTEIHFRVRVPGSMSIKINDNPIIKLEPYSHEHYNFYNDRINTLIIYKENAPEGIKYNVNLEETSSSLKHSLYIEKEFLDKNEIRYEIYQRFPDTNINKFLKPIPE